MASVLAQWRQCCSTSMQRKWDVEGGVPTRPGPMMLCSSSSCSTSLVSSMTLLLMTLLSPDLVASSIWPSLPQREKDSVVAFVFVVHEPESNDMMIFENRFLLDAET